MEAGCLGETSAILILLAALYMTRKKIASWEIIISVLGNDTDVDLDTLNVQAVETASNGTVTSGGQTVTYTPNAGWTGTDSFSYSVSDGNGGTDVIRITAMSGRTVKLSADGSSDPDSDRMDFNWYHYPEAGTYSGNVEINNTKKSKISLMIPSSELAED